MLYLFMTPICWPSWHLTFSMTLICWHSWHLTFSMTLICCFFLDIHSPTLLPPNLFHGIHLFSFLLHDFSMAWSCLHFWRLSFSMALELFLIQRHQFASRAVPIKWICCPDFFHDIDLLFFCFYDIDLFVILTLDCLCVMELLAPLALFACVTSACWASRRSTSSMTLIRWRRCYRPWPMPLVWWHSWCLTCFTTLICWHSFCLTFSMTLICWHSCCLTFPWHCRAGTVDAGFSHHIHFLSRCFFRTTTATHPLADTFDAWLCHDMGLSALMTLYFSMT